MASDSHPDRLRLVIEPDAIERAGALAAQSNDLNVAPQRRPEDMIDLDRFEDEEEDEFVDDEPPRRRRAVPIALAVMALGGFGAVTWWAYTSRLGPAPEEAIPLIRADAGPIKTRPANPGGMEVPYQDKLVLNEMAPDPNVPQVERLLPPPEVPRPPIPQAADPAAGTDGGPKTADVAPAQTGSDLAPAAATPPTAQALPAPPVKPVVPAPPSQAATAPSPVARTPAVPPAPQPAPAATTPAAPAKPLQTAAVGSFLVQFASLKDRALVDDEWARLREAFGDLLGGKELVVQSVDLGSRGTFHRVRAGYFPDRDSAAALCRKVEAKKQACIVVKP